LINLVINAVHAMSEAAKPTLEIRAKVETLEQVVKNQGARKFEVFREGDKVLILEILDNGTGIQSADSGRLFDPFFTTKATGLGTGLGLSVARRIVELHGGEITIRNRSSKRGAVAQLILPTRLETGKIYLRSEAAMPSPHQTD